MIEEPFDLPDDPIDNITDNLGGGRSAKIVPRVVGGTDVGGEPPNVALVTLNNELMRSTAYVELGGHAAYAQETVATFSMPIGDLVKSTQLRCVRIVDVKTMKLRYEHRRLEMKIDGKIRKVPVFNLWKANPKRRQFDRVVYSYKNEPPLGALNLATAWAVTPRRGSWAQMLDHIVENICGGDLNLVTWFLDFLADIFQNPDTKRPICIVLVGEPGTGKTKLLEWLRWLVAWAGLKLDRSSQLLGRFNAHLEGKLVIAVEETAFTSGPREAAMMKDLISSSTLTIEEKFGGVREVANAARIFIATNSLHAFSVEGNDRRILCLHVSNRKARDHAYFRALDEEMANGGDAAMLFDLLKREITSNLNSPPATAALAHQKLRSLDPLHQAMLRVIAAASLRTRDETVVTLPRGEETVRVERGKFNAALEQMVAGPKPHAQAMAEMRKMFGIATTRPRVDGSARERYYELRSAEHMVACLARSLKITPDVIREAIGLDDEALEIDLGGAQ